MKSSLPEVEMMASYSKVFKGSNVSIMRDVKVIAQPVMPAMFQNDGDDSAQNEIPNHQPLIEEAKAQAQEIIQEARQQAESIETDAQERISQWWEENQKNLETKSAAAKEEGLKQGFEIGKQEAAAKVQQEYHDKLTQMQELLEQAYSEKEAIIAEAEPFLLELSTAIATQIIKQELDDHPDKFVEVIKQHILRFKEKEHITICVHPDDFPFIQSQRGHLVSVVNGETEIKIIPDHSVTPKGCVIRTAYGSVDARIDTQMEEIKKVLLEAGKGMQNDVIS
ncbi:FliH/SctL family protein [Neobacillus mesonae]|uniref:FliH/SctL family protein n=1 Tax=Neobacillus mesonae TaxID=1193713 RepID=UPI002040A79D|nr:FliH/SctL family protein [Neobacillus mesonae]MCM3569590.1 FliH/SctL family protein [Neobacillus mesonae]